MSAESPAIDAAQVTAESPHEDAAQTPVPPADAAPITETKGKSRWRGLSRGLIPVIVLLMAAAIFFAISGNWNSWVGSREMQETDDAYLRADLTPLGTRVSGTVAQVAVNDYQKVKAGDLLVQLKDDDYRAQVEQAEAAVRAAEAAIENNQRQKSAARPRASHRHKPALKPPRLKSRKHRPGSKRARLKSKMRKAQSRRRRPTWCAQNRKGGARNHWSKRAPQPNNDWSKWSLRPNASAPYSPAGKRRFSKPALVSTCSSRRPRASRSGAPWPQR